MVNAGKRHVPEVPDRIFPLRRFLKGGAAQNAELELTTLRRKDFRKK
jgi:hypothetical protein